MRDSERAGAVQLVLLGVLWGSIGVIVRDVAVGSPAIALGRMGIGFAAVVAWHAARGRLGTLRIRGRAGWLVLDGILLAVHWALMFEAFKRLSVAAAILIVFVGPVFVAAGARPFLGERVEPRTLGALALSLGGMAIIAVPAWRVQDPAGVAFAFASAILFAALLLVGKRLTATYTPATILAWQLGVGTVAIAPVALAGDLSGLGGAMPRLATLGLVHTALAGFVYFRALAVVKAQHAGVLTYLEPATAVVYAWVFASQEPTVGTLGGGALIVAGGLWIVFTRRPLVASPEEPVAPPHRFEASLDP